MDRLVLTAGDDGDLKLFELPTGPAPPKRRPPPPPPPPLPAAAGAGGGQYRRPLGAAHAGGGLCWAGCGFFGVVGTAGMCSACFRTVRAARGG